MDTTPIRKGLPLSMLILFTQGCYQNYYHATVNPFEAVVGAGNSNAPLKVGVSSKYDAIRRLGEPYLRDEKGAAFGYHQYVDTGVGVWWPILIPVHGGSIQGLHDEYGLLLRFGADSVLTEYEFVLRDPAHHDVYFNQRFDAFRKRAKPTSGKSR